MAIPTDAHKKAAPPTWSGEIATLRKACAELHSSETSQNLRIVELDYEKSQLELKVAALIRLLVESGVVERGKLEATMSEVDAEDGTADGRVTPPGSGRSLFVAAPD